MRIFREDYTEKQGFSVVACADSVKIHIIRT